MFFKKIIGIYAAVLMSTMCAASENDSAGIMPNGKWPCEIPDTRLRSFFNYTPLMISTVQLRPELKGLAFQWPDKRIISLEWDGREWIVRQGERAGDLKESARIQALNPELAFYGSGIMLREGKKMLLDIDYGRNNLNVQLLLKQNSKNIQFKNIDILKPLLGWLFLDETEKNLKQAECLYKGNEKFINSAWKAKQGWKYFRIGQRNWDTTFKVMADAVTAKRNDFNTEADGWLGLLARNPSIADRYNRFVQFASLMLSKSWNLGDFFQKNWFSVLQGMPEYQASVDINESVKRLVNHAMQLSGAAFEKGITVKKGEENFLAVCFTGSLSTVLRDSVFTGDTGKSYKLELAKGEAESFQLILTSGAREAGKISIDIDDIKGPSEISKEQFKIYLVNYIRMVEPYNINFPPSAGGGNYWPDPLSPLTLNSEFSIQADRNQPLWFTLHIPEKTAAGEYVCNINIKIDGNTAVQLPLSVKVFDFAMGKNRMDSISTFRMDAAEKFYGKPLTLEQRNAFRQVLMEHLCNPVSLYTVTPPDEIEYFAKSNANMPVIMPSFQYLAMPRTEDLIKYTELYGSRDGKEFERIPAKVELVPQGKPDTDDWILTLIPDNKAKDYNWFKIHYSEARVNKTHFCQERFFKIDAQGKSLELTGEDNNKINISDIKYITGDAKPKTIGSGTVLNNPDIFEFDMANPAHPKTLPSIIFRKDTDKQIGKIVLLNSSRKKHIAYMKDVYEKFRKTGGRDLKIISYGFDEGTAELNPQILSALKLCKKLFPDVLTATTALAIIEVPECYKYLDINCQSTGRFFLNEEKALCRGTNTKLWYYIGAGPYYPYSCFERVDQPLINSRAYFWPGVTYNLDGWLYWRINLWENNIDAVKKWPEIWDEWNPSYSNKTNGMGALIYPGPDCTPIPSMRLEAMRDGIEDYNYFKIAETLLNKRKFTDGKLKSEITEFIEKSKNRLSPGFSGFLEDPAETQKIRHDLALYIEKMNRLAE